MKDSRFPWIANHKVIDLTDWVSWAIALFLFMLGNLTEMKDISNAAALLLFVIFYYYLVEFLLYLSVLQ